MNSGGHLASYLRDEATVSVRIIVSSLLFSNKRSFF